MRILMLAQCYWPDVGGVETHVRNLSEALVQRGHHVAVATVRYPGMPAFEIIHGVRVHRIRMTMQRAGFLYTTSRQLAPPFPDPEAMRGIQRVICDETPDVVHGHNWLQRSFLPVGLRQGIRFVVTLHDYSAVCPTMTLMRNDAVCTGPSLAACPSCASTTYGPVKGLVTVAGNALGRRIEVAHADLTIAVSRDVALRNHLNVSSGPCRVIPNFLPIDVPLDDLHPALQQLPRGDFLLFVGDLRSIKGIRVLLSAYAQCPDAPPLVLVGRATTETPASLPDNVIPLGALPPEAVAQVRRRSLITFVPSIFAEAFGIVVIEAMAAGNLVIASRIGAIPDIITDGEDGLLVPPGDAQALVMATQHALSDAGLRQRIGQAACRRAQDFSASKVVPQIEQVYRDVIAA